MNFVDGFVFRNVLKLLSNYLSSKISETFIEGVPGMACTPTGSCFCPEGYNTNMAKGVCEKDSMFLGLGEFGYLL